MACCNQRRQAARPRSAVPPRVTAPADSDAAPADSDAAAVALRYIGSRSIRVQGPRSAQIYTAGPAKRVVRVDARDVDALLRTGVFTS